LVQLIVLYTYFDQLHGHPQATRTRERNINFCVMCKILVLCARVTCGWPCNWSKYVATFCYV